MVRYSFLVGLFHPRLHAGLSRRLRLLTRAARKTCGINNALLSRDRTRALASKGAVVSAESPKVLSTQLRSAIELKSLPNRPNPTGIFSEHAGRKPGGRAEALPHRA